MTSPESKRKLRDLEAAAAREEARERMFKHFRGRYAAEMRWPFIRHGAIGTGYVYSGAGERICIGDRMHSPSGIVIVVPDLGDERPPRSWAAAMNTIVLVRPEGGDDDDIYWSTASGLIHELADIESVEKYLNG